jgi:antitoxin HicB
LFRLGATEAKAAREAQRAIAAWLEAATAAGRAIPEPSVGEPLDRYSGKFVVRVPRSVHARLARKAKQEGVSLNQLVSSVLSRM